MLKEKKFKYLENGNSGDKYDRVFVKKFTGTHLSFSQTSCNSYDDYYSRGNKKMENYINRCLTKFIGKSVNEAFSWFSHLKWDSKRVMYWFWDSLVDDVNWNGEIWGFYTAEDGTLQYRNWKIERNKERTEQYENYETYTPEQLKFNSTRVVPNFGKAYESPSRKYSYCGNLLYSAKTYRYINDFYLNIGGKIVKLPVYNVPLLHYHSYNDVNPHRKGEKSHESFEFINKTFIPITIYGTKGELSLYNHYYDYYSKDEKYYDDNGKSHYKQVRAIGDLGYGKLDTAIMVEQLNKILKK